MSPLRNIPNKSELVNDRRIRARKSHPVMEISITITSSGRGHPVLHLVHEWLEDIESCLASVCGSGVVVDVFTDLILDQFMKL